MKSVKFNMNPVKPDMKAKPEIKNENGQAKARLGRPPGEPIDFRKEEHKRKAKATYDKQYYEQNKDKIKSRVKTYKAKKKEIIKIEPDLPISEPLIISHTNDQEIFEDPASNISILNMMKMLIIHLENQEKKQH